MGSVKVAAEGLETPDGIRPCAATMVQATLAQTLLVAETVATCDYLWLLEVVIAKEISEGNEEDQRERMLTSCRVIQKEGWKSSKEEKQILVNTTTPRREDG